MSHHLRTGNGHTQRKVLFHKRSRTYQSNGNTNTLDCFFGMDKSYAKTWCATLYNVSTDELAELIRPHIKEATYQEELCPTTNRKHIQAVFKFNKRRRFTDLKKLFGRFNPHLELCRNYLQATKYCSKEESRIGNTVRVAAPKSRDETIRDYIERGDLQTIRSEYYGFYLRHRRALLEDMVARYTPKECPHTRGIWVSGLSGCGKTQTVAKLCNQLYWKGQNKWWDGYTGEPIVLMDDFDIEAWKWAIHFIKRWTDHYPIIGETKGGNVQLNYEWFIVTSNDTLQESIYTLETNHRQAITRRFKQLDFRNDNVERELQCLLASSQLASEAPIEVPQPLEAE